MLINEFAKVGKSMMRAMTNTVEFKSMVLPLHNSACSSISTHKHTELTEREIQIEIQKIKDQSADHYAVKQARKFIMIVMEKVDLVNSRNNEDLENYYALIRRAKEAISSVSTLEKRNELYKLLSFVQSGGSVDSHSFAMEKEENELPTKTELKRLSKYATLQLLFYHFLQPDENGVICHVSEKLVASILGCSVRTVKNNNIMLEKAGLIYYTHNSNHVNIWLLDYSDYHQEGGSGYERITYAFFQELLKVDMVNSIRFMIRQELKYDNDTPKRRFNKNKENKVFSKISFNDAKVFLPKYTHYQNMIKRIATMGSTVFEIRMEGSDVYFVMDENYYGKHLYEKRQKEYLDKINQYLVKYEEEAVQSGFTNVERQNFAQLCFEYGFDRVSEALSQLIHVAFYSSEAELIENKGGYVRSYIRSHILKNEKMNAPVLITA